MVPRAGPAAGVRQHQLCFLIGDAGSRWFITSGGRRPAALQSLQPLQRQRVAVQWGSNACWAVTARKARPGANVGQSPDGGSAA